MNNYHLLYTNPLLGGNMKYDVILKPSKDNVNVLELEDFHITPISDRLPYNRYSDDDLLNWKHQDNIKDYYKEVRGDFYKSFTDPVFSSGYPLRDYDKCYDETFLSGARRLEYGLYNKQIQYFIPLWIDNMDLGDEPDKNKYIKFEITLKWGEDENDKYVYYFIINLINPQNKFDQYIKDYMEYVGICNTNGKLNDIININLKERKGYIKGLEVSSGNVVTKDISDTVDFLLYRERPMVETNSAIIETFSKNNVIVPNIFNFNLCFDFNNQNNPIRSETISVYAFDGRQIEYNGGSVEAILDKKCFFSEYDNLRKTKIVSEDIDIPINEYIQTLYSVNTDRPMITQYLRDHECIDLVNKNKIPKNIIHWQTSYQYPYRNNRQSISYEIYPFNLYGGFPDVRIKPIDIKTNDGNEIEIAPPEFDTVIFKRSLNSLEIEKPSKKAKEFKYIKNNGVLKYLYRVGGSLRPMFIWPKFDTFYTYYNAYKKEIIDDSKFGKDSKNEKDKIFDKYLPSKLPPSYPSIGYTPYIVNNLIPDDEGNDTNNPKVQAWVYKPNEYEFKWFNHSCLYNLPVEYGFSEKIISKSLIHNDVQDEELKKEIYNKIAKKLGFVDNNCNFQYILSKYNITYNMKSVEKASGQNYNYNIDIKLKLK